MTSRVCNPNNSWSRSTLLIAPVISNSVSDQADDSMTKDSISSLDGIIDLVILFYLFLMLLQKLFKIGKSMRFSLCSDTIVLHKIGAIAAVGIMTSAVAMPAISATNTENQGYESVTFPLAPAHAINKRLDVRSSNYAHGQWMEIWESNNGGNQQWTFVGNGDGTFTMRPRDALNLCLTRNANGGTHTSNPGSWTVDANNPWSWTGGSSYVLHATIANCTGDKNQIFFAQKTGNKLDSSFSNWYEFTYLIRSVDEPRSCLNTQGNRTGDGSDVIWYDCQWGTTNDRWAPSITPPFSSKDVGYWTLDTKIFAHWADIYALMRGTGNQSAMTLDGRQAASGASPFTTIRLNSSSKRPVYTTAGGVLLPMYDSNLGYSVNYINNTTGSSLVRSITTSKSKTVQTTFGFKEQVGYKFTQKVIVKDVSETTNEFSFGFEASQQISNTVSDTTSISYTANIPNNSAFWMATSTSGSVSAEDAVWDVYNDVGDHARTDPMTATISFGTSNGVSYCGTGSVDQTCRATKPSGAL